MGQQNQLQQQMDQQNQLQHQMEQHGQVHQHLGQQNQMQQQIGQQNQLQHLGQASQLQQPMAQQNQLQQQMGQPNQLQQNLGQQNQLQQQMLQPNQLQQQMGQQNQMQQQQISQPNQLQQQLTQPNQLQQQMGQPNLLQQQQVLQSNLLQQQQQMDQPNQLQQHITQQNQLQQQRMLQPNQLQQQQMLQPNQLQQQQMAQPNQLQQHMAQQNQLQQSQLGQIHGGNMSLSALMGQTGNLPMLSGQVAAAASPLNLPNQFLSSPQQKASFMQGTQFLPGSSLGQSLPGVPAAGMMGSVNLNSQLRTNGALAYAQQRMNPGQIRQNALTAQNMTKISLMNAQLSGHTQNGPSGVMHNALAQPQWLKQMSSMSSLDSSLRFPHRQQLLIQQQIASSQSHQGSVALSPQHLSQLAQMGHLHQQKQQQTNQQFFHQQQSPRSLVDQKSVSLTGSHPDAAASGTPTPCGSSSQGTEGGNQLLGKRKIQDLAAQLDINVKVDPEVEDLLLEFADNFIDSVTTFACSLAKHRKSTILEAKDVMLHLDKNLKLKIPGYSSEHRSKFAGHQTGDAHKKRLDLIRNMVEQSYPTSNDTPNQVSRQGPNFQAFANNIVRQSPSSEQLTSSQQNGPQHNIRL